MGSSSELGAVVRCQCGNRFYGVTENDAIAGHVTHIEAYAERDEVALHVAEYIGPADGEGAPDFLHVTAHKEELHRMLDERATERSKENGDWPIERELQLYRQALLTTTVAAHISTHQGEGPNWRNCRRWACMYTAMTLPEVEEVQWLGA